MDGVSTQQGPRGKNIEPLSLQMYFEAFLNRLNQIGRFVPRPNSQGFRKGLVEITIYPNGETSARVIRTADQQAEIDYINQVLKQGSPFQRFPPDLRQAADKLTLMMCIVPARDGIGAGFSRTFGSDCRD